MIQESTILMTFHSQLTRSFLHGHPFLRCLKHGNSRTRKKHGVPTAQFGIADLCGPKSIARQINEMTWGLKRWDLTIQTEWLDQIRSEEWKDGVMCSWDLATPPTSVERYHFFHECSKPLEHGHDRRFFPNSMIVEELWLWKFEPNTARQVIWSTYSITASGQEKELI